MNESVDFQQVEQSIEEKRKAARAAYEATMKEAETEAANLKALVEQSIAYKKKKAEEEALKAKVAEQNQMIDDAVTGSVEKVLAVVDRFDEWKQRCANLIEYVNTETRAIEAERTTLFDDLNRAQDKVAAAVGTLNIDHGLIHDNNSAKCATNYAQRIARSLGHFDGMAQQSLTIRINEAPNSEFVGMLIYGKLKAYITQMRGKGWVAANLPEWRNIQK